jgi:hypothetical protein
MNETTFSVLAWVRLVLGLKKAASFEGPPTSNLNWVAKLQQIVGFFKHTSYQVSPKEKQINIKAWRPFSPRIDRMNTRNNVFGMKRGGNPGCANLKRNKS